MTKKSREKWDARYRNPERHIRDAPSPHLLHFADHLPPPGRALDVAGGAGRHAIWLARRGWDATCLDISPAGLSLARRRAARAGVAIRTLEWDVEETGTLPSGPWDLILQFHFLHRPLFALFPDLLRPGGRLLVVQPTLRNLERHDRPPKRFLLKEGELPTLVGDLAILAYDEGWLERDRHEARLLAQKPLP